MARYPYQSNNSSLGEIIASVVVIMFLAMGGCMCGDYECDIKARMMGLPSSYGPVQGCMIKVDNKWIPLESYRTVD